MRRKPGTLAIHRALPVHRVLWIIGLCLLFAVAWLCPCSKAFAQVDNHQILERALDYLHANMRANGGFSTNSSSGDLGITPWVVLALAASGYDPTSWTCESGSLVQALAGMNIAKEATQGSGSVNAPAFYSKIILALCAAGRADMVRAAGSPPVDLVQRLLAYRHISAGNFSLSTTDPSPADISTTIWAILALSSVQLESEVVEKAVAWLLSVQGNDGGFSFQTGAVKDIDDTAAAIQALLAGGIPRDHPAVKAAISFLRQHQNPDGGFPSWVTDRRSTAESTAWTLQALNALGEDINAWKKQNSPVQYLVSLQRSSGLFAHQGSQVATPLMTTTQAVIALSGKSFPVRPGNLRSSPDFRPRIVSLSLAEGSQISINGAEISIEVEDFGTGIDPKTFTVRLDETTITPDTSRLESEGIVRFTTGSLRPGSHKLSVSFSDRAGHTVKKQVSFTASTEALSESVLPPSGNGPYVSQSSTISTPILGDAESTLQEQTTVPRTLLSKVGTSQESAPASATVDAQNGAGMPVTQAEDRVATKYPLPVSRWFWAALIGGVAVLALTGAGLCMLGFHRRSVKLAKGLTPTRSLPRNTNARGPAQL